MRLIALAFGIAFLAISATAQTAKDINARYGAPHESYEIRPGIFMTAKFAPDGRLCQMSVEKRHVKSSGAIFVDETFMSPDEMAPIVDELIPVSERGKESKLSGHILSMSAGMTTTYDYENVTITYYGNLMRHGPRTKAIVTQGTAAVVIQSKNRGCN